ncbi:MAG: hypothetical protein EZS28_007237 [Streblomastix strix]|uniref:Uncharacterized protein n=1 Tax=Streblomastix strix TaxID=222440 RepID=A0A5J4WT05_9EUKA|nr:MAG: hypothetical protein EZS28_007237 [Streblomastix strix]
MDQHMLCNPEERARKVEKDHGLFSIIQIPLCNTLYNGGCLESQIYPTTQRLDDQNRLRVGISPYSSGLGIQTIPKLLLQPEVLPLQGYAFWSEACSSNLSQNISPSNQIHQKGHKGSHHILLRRHHLFTPRSRGIEGEEVADNQLTDELLTEDISQKIIDKKNDSNVRIMKKDCTEQTICESEVPGELHRFVKLPEVVDQTGRTPSEEAKQDQGLGCVNKKIELICVFYMYVLKEIFWWKTMIQKNKPIQATLISPQAILATNASKTNQGDILKMSHPDLEIMFLGKWSSNRHISRSNQREEAGILCALRRSETYLREKLIRSLKIETDNSSTAYNINRSSAAVALVKLTDRVLETAEDLNLQLHAFHILGKLNVIPISPSRLAFSGDYQIRQDVLTEALFALQIRPSINMFANRRNGMFKRFMTLVLDNQAKGQDCLSHPWSGEVPYLHPPIPMIQVALNKAKQEGVPAVIVVPNWPSQPWWPSLAEQTVKYVNVGRSVDIQKPGGRMRIARKHFPLVEMLEFTSDATDKVIEGWHSIWRRHRQRISEFEEFWMKQGKSWEDIMTVKDPEIVISNFLAQKYRSKSSDANTNASRTAIGMLFRIQDFQEKEINGFVLKQMMKKPQYATRKKRKEEPMYKFDILLRYIQGKFGYVEQLSEQEHMGCVISSIMTFTTEIMYKKFGTYDFPREHQFCRGNWNRLSMSK